MSETIHRVYELGYLLVPTIPETEAENAVGKLKELIEKLEGKIVSEGAPEFIDLAYTMEKTIASKKAKYSQAYFGWTKLEAAPEAIESMKKALDLNAEVIRYLLVKTSAENIVLFKKPKIEARRETVIDEEELDAAIAEEDLKEDHELLPNVEGDILEETAVQAPSEQEEKEE